MTKQGRARLLRDYSVKHNLSGSCHSRPGPMRTGHPHPSQDCPSSRRASGIAWAEGREGKGQNSGQREEEPLKPWGRRVPLESRTCLSAASPLMDGIQMAINCRVLQRCFIPVPEEPPAAARCHVRGTGCQSNAKRHGEGEVTVSEIHSPALTPAARRA